jgi:hypothetical protein
VIEIINGSQIDQFISSSDLITHKFHPEIVAPGGLQGYRPMEKSSCFYRLLSA